MGTKRAHSEVDSDVAMQDVPEQDQRHDSPEADDGEQPASKRSKTGPDAAKRKHKAKEGTANWNKTRARTIRRLLQSGKELPATVRNELEQELGALEERVEDHSFKKRRSQMISKYHMVRFFERKKAERLLKQLRKKIQQSEDPEEKKRLEAEAHVAEVDVAYARFFPLMERYESLYPNKDKNGDGQGEGEAEAEVEEKPADETDEKQKPFKQPKALRALHAERPKMWATIEKTLPEGEAALYRLRDRKSPTDADATASKKRPERPAKKQDAKGKPASGPGSGPGRTKNLRPQEQQFQKDRARGRKHEDKGFKWKAPVQQDDDEDDGTGFFN
ncbi:rRNA-processing protein efg1 [Colletotrichum sojae]|uniref:rRNA-processing protein EFG1 n=1 Tax=Colletotrichum sojae TaxID=2175907 RepID=A0A8H6JUD0_9PEZI|nr:rRNA-processing protein efg1 [Colletotrichum sojae]